nr:hypothetical protein [Tanacetum cinerariifolium]
MNPGLNTRFWTRKDVDRSKEFMFAIQKQLKTRRIFCNLESFVGGRVRDGDYRLLKHTSEGDRKAVRTHMRILSVVRIEVFSMYGYDYMKKIVLRHLNHLPPKDKKILTTAVNLWTRHMVIRQRVEDFQLGIESYQTQLNLTKPRWDATIFEYKHDYTLIDSSRVVTFRARYGVPMIMASMRSTSLVMALCIRLMNHWTTGLRNSRSLG